MSAGDTADSSGAHALFVRRPIAALVVFVTLIVVGVISYARIPLQMMPDGMTEPGLWVDVIHPGSSAAENERKVARILEEQIRTLAGIESVHSRSQDDSVDLDISYRADADMDLAKAELRDRLERARPLLPTSVEEIFVWSWSQDQMPIAWLAILNTVEDERTDYLVDSVLKRRIESLEGIGRMEIFGVLDDSIRVLLDEDRVIAANLDLGALIRRLANDNFAEPLGEVEDGGTQYLLRADMRFATLEEVENYPVGDGLRIADIGRVVRAKSVRDRLSRIDGDYAYYAAVNAESQANIVDAGRRLKETLAELERDPALEGRFRFINFFNQGDFIVSSLAQLESTALWGGGFAVAILFVFLRRIRLTLCVALSIPVSALLAIAWVYFRGGTFNVLTMSGITLGVGMLVDNSVVVIENIARLHAEGGTARGAAVRGTREVALAVALATLTTVVVFAPLIFMVENPVLRLLFGSLGVPLCMSLLFSLLVALVFLPVIAARLLGQRPAPVERCAAALAPIAALPARAIHAGLGVLRRLRHRALAVLHRAVRALLALLTPLRWLLAAAIVALAAWRVREFLALPRDATLGLAELGLAPRADTPGFAAGLAALLAPAALGLALLLVGLPRWHRRPRRFAGRSSPPPAAGASIVDLIAAANRDLVAWTMRHRLAACLLAAAGLASVVVPIGSLDAAAFGQDQNRGRIDITVEMEDEFTLAETSAEMAHYESWLERERAALAFDHVSCRFRPSSGRVTVFWNDSLAKDAFDAARERLIASQPKIAGHRVLFRDEDSASDLQRDLVTFRLEGPDAEGLAVLAEAARARLAQVPGLRAVTTPLENAPPQVRVRLDEAAFDYGVSASIAQENISWALRGVPLPRFQEAGREVPFYIEYDEEQVAGLDTLRELAVWTMEGAIPLTNFARLEFGRGARTIHRQDGRTTIEITAQIDDPTRQARLYEAGLNALADLDFPRGYDVVREDSVLERRNEEMADMFVALRLAIVLVFVIMCILFESYTRPFAVMAIVPFSTVGALWALHLAGRTLDSVGMIGIVILVGVVVKNGIVLVDGIHQLEREGLPRERAVVDGAAQRVRPILMTALTTICGLIPMAIAEPPSEGIDYRALATCVAGGLFFSTFFTLSVVPLAYVMIAETVTGAGRAVRWGLRAGGRGALNAAVPQR